MPPVTPYTNLTLGLNPEVLNQYFQQFYSAGFPNGIMGMGIGSDMGVVYQLTTAQLLTLQTTAVQLVAPPTVTGIPTYLVPPGGFLYVPTTLTMEYKYGGTAFTIGGSSVAFQIEYTGQTTNLLSMNATGLVDQVVSKVATNLSASTGPIIANTLAANLGLEVKLAGTTPTLTLGNGTVYLSMLYNLYALF